MGLKENPMMIPKKVADMPGGPMPADMGGMTPALPPTRSGPAMNPVPTRPGPARVAPPMKKPVAKKPAKKPSGRGR